ncbi:hypothetical protein TREAZ_0339 [Leadbettera azotonutricia ZAS-9]|uniref:Uncharacterized protein n=1 Tax=Leadbettera azotonutricia (strain ATCC BAA-888 / DSM 13862 / ZAS-9) TaxID=545695 RepID=F5YDI7_LEAAZ|nr:hypothetical protein TREAZ_0339 [Leadbettera azotonutricia ZAS-9]
MAAALCSASTRAWRTALSCGSSWATELTLPMDAATICIPIVYLPVK